MVQQQSSPAPLTLRNLNAMDESSFVSALSGIYESSPWVAAAVAGQRPFSSASQLASAMASVVNSSDSARQLGLIQAHPELALKGAAAAGLTENSRAEQAASGMASMEGLAQAQFERYSAMYRARHGFPFIVAVLTLDRDAIVRSLGERMFNSTEAEQRRALVEIDKIAAIRLHKLLGADSDLTPLASPPMGATRSSAGTTLRDVQYGKSRVRVLKVLRDTPTHQVLEVTAQVLLRGAALDCTFTRGDNALVVPTDTVKNTVTVLARESLTDSIEEFGARIGAHFLAQYKHLDSVDVRLDERVWSRMRVASETSPGVFNGPLAPHAHSFEQLRPDRPFTHVVSTRGGVWIESGVRDYMVLKSTASGFAHFPRCALTTLPETDDRILATKIAATWSFQATPKEGFRAANERILRTLLDRFATRYSVSVQATVYEMTLDALAAVPSLGGIKITLPNVHFLLFNMAPFKLDNSNRVFVPTDEPHGTIELQVTRDGRQVTPHSNKAGSIALNELVFPSADPCAPLPPRPRL